MWVCVSDQVSVPSRPSLSSLGKYLLCSWNRAAHSPSIFMNGGQTQNPFGPHLLALLSPLPCSRLRIWISGCQTLQCPLTPRLSRPLSLSFPILSTVFYIILFLTLQNPLCSSCVASRSEYSLHTPSSLLSPPPAFHRSSNMFLSHSTAALCSHACVWCF